jgi:arylsulfatase A-like enzyme
MQRHTPEGIQLRPNVPNVRWVVERARRDLAGYYAMIENLDWNMGRILSALQVLGLAESTYIVFFSDHGDMLGSHGREWKCVPHEESIRIPFVVARGSGDGLPLSTGRCDAPINHVDIAPTTLGLCGLPKPDWMVGFDWSAYLRPDRHPPGPEPDSALLQLVDPGWRLGFAPDRERPWRGVVTRDGWKYAVLEGQPWMMYNLNDDPYELVNLALDGRFWTERKRLQARLAAWIEGTGDSFHLPKI